MEVRKKIVVLMVSLELNWVLVVSEKRVVTITKICERTAHKEGLLNWGVVGHWTEEVSSQLNSHELFEEAITHLELFASS